MGLGGGASGSRKESTMKFSSQNFGLKFWIAQIPIVRPWFKSAFLLSKSWRFDQNTPEARDQHVSNGESPPKGLIPAYPTMLGGKGSRVVTRGRQRLTKFVSQTV